MDATVNRVAGLKFLQVEIQTGLTFARIAQTTNPDMPSRFERNVKNARRAYDSAMEFRRRIVLDGEQKVTVDAGLTRLKTLLQALGEPL